MIQSLANFLEETTEMEQWPDAFQSCSEFTGSNCSYRLKFFVAKNHLRSNSLSNCSLLDSRLLDHVQHALLKGLSTQRVWHCACAYALLSRD